MTNNTAPKPRIEKLREAGHRNGALSHGPSSAMNKSISACNDSPTDFTEWSQYGTWITETAIYDGPVRTDHALESSLARTSALQVARNSRKSENCRRNPANSNKTLDISLILDPAEPGEPTEEKGNL